MCTMTRSHFQFIADSIRNLPATTDERKAWIAAHFADELRRTNSGFKRSRFLKACGVSEEL